MTGGGQAVLNLRLATTESYLDKDKARQERTEWHMVVLWGKRAEGLSKILRKGDRVFIEGGLRTTSWEDKDGNKRYRTEVVASDVILSGAKNASRPAARDEDPEPEPMGRAYGSAHNAPDDDIPF